MAEPAPDVTQMLLAWRGGNHEALQQLLPLVYGELRRLARHNWLGQPLDHGRIYQLRARGNSSRCRRYL